ncbi:hypothetical protein NC661_00815 [Aquibacillus koreensis]|uniref:Uncharacterized protein n=1 Tax=Aquibacillus koreensis TaxID=279446 RepID=A0A9X3WIC4_9BACI|nr:hypothetical protein [Aquibacillus koreensis]MCT2537480.1 hypothetical protein [Aquibacillus koreensis]MDC3418926.1 hypothetical protein [Aquibacillus koreensis]
MYCFNKEIENSRISTEDIDINENALRLFDHKDWKLIYTYVHRFLHVSGMERNKLTNQVASLLLSKLDINVQQLNTRQEEDLLLSLYLNLKEEWDFEL